MQINPYDCTGCGSCVNVCPTKALVMAPIDEVKQKELDNYNLSLTLKNIPNPLAKTSVKGSQFETSYFDVSGACAGCGETPYIKLLTQLFGSRMIIANATGCSSIYGGSSPTCPYKKDDDGRGPAWANSLFEDNAEFGLGIKLGLEKRREQLIDKVNLLLNTNLKNNNLTAYLKMFLLNYNDVTTCENLEKSLLMEVENSLLEESSEETIKLLKFIKANKNLIVPKSFWIIGGDGWAYDIGFSGIDHILASGKNVNILVLDTEVYSNTGGQSSKASPIASVTKFNSGGKKTSKKDLALYAMNYKNVYVASVAMGGNPLQLLKALTEAEEYDGPSIIIAYSTCINHGINMSTPQQHMKEAVDSGYWSLFRHNPALKLQNKNPFVLDSKNANTENLITFLKTENRYNQLFSGDEQTAKALFEQAKQEADERIKTYKKLAEIE
jgi:pyruvate-ferredoxin/flavodoxin oxidoreductase